MVILREGLVNPLDSWSAPTSGVDDEPHLDEGGGRWGRTEGQRGRGVGKELKGSYTAFAVRDEQRGGRRLL